VVEFLASVSGGSTPYTYAWDFGDETSSTERNPSHTFESAGTYTVRLTITDEEGQTATTSGAIRALEDLPTLSEGPVVWLPFDEGSGTVAQDASGHGNAGSIHGADWASYRDVTVLSFEANTDYVEVALAGMRPEAGTVSLWAYPTASSDRSHCLFYHTTQPPWDNRIQLKLDADTGRLILGLGDKHELNKDIATLPLQRWSHIALTWDQGAYRVYVDGNEAAAGSYTGLDRIGAFADIGNNGDPGTRQSAFFGMIDEVRLYDVALAPYEIAALAAQGPEDSGGDAPRTPAGLRLR
jgi:PKD repeat protein